MQEGLIPRRNTALCIALAALSVPCAALELGPPEVLSAIGEKLDARIPLRSLQGEWFHASCLSLAPATASAPFPADGVLSVERRRSSTHLRVRSQAPVQEPALAFGVSSTCAGAAQLVGAPVTLLIDPPRADRRPGPRAQAPVMPRRSTERPRSSPPAPQPAAVAATAPPSPPRGESATPVTAAPPAPAARAPATDQYVLRLSSGDIDLSRSRQFDEPSRARLRERLRLLDSDDQVAEMLSMRDNLRRLEARVAELQLKLASMPQSFQAPARSQEAAPAGGAAAPVPAAAATVATPPSPVPEPSTPAVARAPKTAAPAVAPPPASPPEAILGAVESFQGRLIGAAVAILVLLVMLGAWLWSRWRQPVAREDEPLDTDGPATVLMDREEPAAAEAPIEIAPPKRAEVTSDAALATRLDEDTEALRRRYIEERFPEIRAGTLVLDDAASVVKAARLFYEDGAMPRAVELLRFAIEDRPGEVRPWLALFEIYRLERLAGEYGELAGRFRDGHGDGEQWPKVRAFGRELDPANALYEEPPLKSLETIGPQAARRLAAAQADPVAENWLDAPMDFENEVLATELRRALMGRAGVDERDLAPNPMPALRNVEMFSVG